MCDIFSIETADLSFFHASPSSCHLERPGCDQEIQDAAYFYYEECPDSFDPHGIESKEEENAGLASKLDRRIIPDYLLKNVQDYHEREGVEPDQAEKDRHNREESEKMRQYRQQVQHSGPIEGSLKNKDFGDGQ